MHGEYNRAIAPRVFMTAAHGAAVAATGWLLVGGGLQTVRAHWRADWNLASPVRRWLLFSAVLIYFLRVCATSFYSVEAQDGLGRVRTDRRLDTHHRPPFSMLGGVNPGAVGLVTVLGVLLYVVGSYLNTASELQRKWWKENPQNAGHLLTGGLSAMQCTSITLGTNCFSQVSP